MSRRGPSECFVLVDGYDLTAVDIGMETFSSKAINKLEEYVGLGNDRVRHVPIGVRAHEITQGPVFFDTTAGRSHEAIGGPKLPGTPQAVARVVCFGADGEAVGRVFTGYEGAFESEYEPTAPGGELQKAVATYVVSGEANEGVILQPLAVKTADWNTESTPVDNAASSANGGVGYLQVVAASGFTNFVGKIRDSPDDITYSDLITFTDSVAAELAERRTVAGTVDRYLAFDGNVTGSGSITVFCGFSRN